MMKRIITAVLTTAVMGTGVAQSPDWVELMQDPTVNFYTVQQSFNSYWAEREIEKGKGWKQFKRWEYFMEPRVYPEGNRPDPAIINQAYEQLLSSTQAPLGQWKPLGPHNGPALDGIGRANRLAFDPQNPSIIWLGTPAGGLWKSIDGGQNWTTNTDKLSNLGISDIVIHPTNSNIMYIATGDRDGADTYSFGVLKSTDGGNTWASTGLTHNVTQQIRLTDLYINPDSPNILLASSFMGIYRTTDAGANWTLVRGGGFNEIVQKPGNPNVLFTSSLNSGSCRIFRSLDNGQNWTLLNDPALPLSNSRRIELAVTDADSNYIYALYGANDNSFAGVYRSTDGGNTWSMQSNSPNLLGWRTDGSDGGGQAWYDLALAVNPINKNELFVGGVNIWKSNNGGTSWSLASHWYGGGGAPFVHADVHDLEYHPSSYEVYACTDGGLYRDRANQFAWDELNDGINITQYYKMGTSINDTVAIVAGAQDNGTHLRNSGGWTDIYGGDGMDCAVNTKNSNIVYASVYYGDFYKSTNGGFSFNAPFNLPPSGTGNWVTPLLMDPNHPDTLYAGFSSVWRSYNGGSSFVSLNTSSISGGGNIDVLAIAPAHSNVVFMANGNDAWKSMDYGTTWTKLKFGGSRVVTGIAAAHDNPDHIVVTKSGYIAGDKVYESRDGGNTFSNISSGLTNIPVNCVIIENNAQHSVYIGTDLGVFYKDDLNPNWVSFNQNLPNVIVNELEINYKNRKLRAATYGRGVWETPLFSDLLPPLAQAKFPSAICVSDTVQLKNASLYSPDSFEWQISPSTFSFVNGSGVNSENPEVIFNQKGFYSIRLKVANAIGSDSIEYVQDVVVGGRPISYSTDLQNNKDLVSWDYTNDINGWELTNFVGSKSFRAPMFSSTPGHLHELTSPALDFSGHDSVWLNFDYAHSGTSTNSNDSLLIYISSDCDSNFNLLAAMGENGSGNFRTAPVQNTAFVPGTAEWCSQSNSCPSLNLSSFAGLEGVRIKFIAKSAGGNHLYLDNIEVAGNPNILPTANFGGINSACALDTVQFSDQSYGSATSWSWTFSGPQTLTSADKNPNVSFAIAGSYDVSLKVTNPLGSDSIYQAGRINISPADSVAISLAYDGSFYCFHDTLKLHAQASNPGNNPIYEWYRNGVKLSGEIYDSLAISNLNPGETVFVKLKSSASCAFPEVAFSDTVSINAFPAVAVNISSLPTMCETAPSTPLSATPPGGTFSGNGISGNLFDPSVAGAGQHKITYSYTDGNGCTFSDNILVQVNPLPNITVSNSTFCMGTGARPLTIASPAGGQYSGAGIKNNNIFPDSLGPGKHPVTYTYQSSSCGTVTKTFDVEIAQPLSPTVVVHQGSLECSVTAQAYQWYRSNGSSIPGANAKTFVPSIGGSYRVDIVDSNGCYASSPYAGIFVGLNEHLSDLGLSIFPNPANSMVTISFEDHYSEKLKLQIFDIRGKLVFTQGNINSQQTLDISAFAKGIYLFQLSGDDIKISRRLIKN